MATDTADRPAATKYRPDPTRHVWQVPAFLLGVAVFVGAWQGWLPLGTPDPTADYARELAALRTAYEKVNPDRDDLRDLLTRVAARCDAFPEYATAAHFSLGSGYARLAELTPAADEARTHWTLARQHFDLITAEQLRDPADGPRLAFRSAKARAGVGLPAAASPADARLLMSLLAGAPANEDPGDAQRLLADLALKLSPPDLNVARDALTRYLTSAGIATPPASLARARLQLADVHVRRKEPDLARKWLEQIGPDAPPEVVAPARSLLARVRMADEDWLGAARDWEAVRSAPGASPETRATTAYYLGLCRLNTKDLAAATKLFEESAKGSNDEARSASIRLAELLLKGTDAAKRAAVPDLLAAALKGVAARKDYTNSLVPLNDLFPVFELGITVLNVDGAYEAATRLVESYEVVAPSRAREKKAETLAAWATALQRDGKDFKPTARAAAAEYEALAGSQPAPTAKVDTLRRAAGMYKAAGDPARTVAVLESAAQLPALPDATVSAVLAELAEALVAGKRPGEALKALNEAMARTTPISTAVRYRLGRQFLDSHKPELADLGRNLLEQVAKQETVAPAEREYHELALVGLGYEVMRTNNYAEAEVWLRKQVTEYPGGPEASLGRLFLGICLIQRAGASGASAPDAAGVTRMRDEAVKLFKQVVADADAKQKKDGKLSERDAWVRLQAGLRVLQTYQQMHNPKDLLAEAPALLERHRGTVDELIILSLVYHAFKQKNEPGLSLQTRDQMKDLFDRLPARAFPATKGEYSREYWEKVWFPADPK
ncbi:hypothetical protein : [Gemmataceae bacterium]|nr:hypothetical protein : [Gemmataceae bacterium]VTU02023.1 hypothetical protein : [Gemmataceae bacterium]